MLGRLRRWREDRVLERSALPPGLWDGVVAGWPVLQRYPAASRERIRDLAQRLMLRKSFEGAGDLFLDEPMCLRIAAMAVTPVLELEGDLDWYDGWHSIIVYPGEFIPGQEYEDEDGVVHMDRHPLSGEAWPQGPVILSWDDVLNTSGEEAYNVVIHEMAHKLDMRSDGANGAPPLGRGLDPARWREVFTAAWEEMERLAEQDPESLPLDPYALENPGEFFAVVSEAFFESPQRLESTWPQVYDQLRAFYRQDPARPS